MNQLFTQLALLGGAISLLFCCDSTPPCRELAGQWTNREGQVFLFQPNGKAMWLIKFGSQFDTFPIEYRYDCKQQPVALDLTSFKSGLNLFLIPRYQAFGTAVAAVLTQSFVSVGLMWLCAKTFGFWPSRNWWLRVAGFAVFVFAANWLVFEKTDLGWWVKCGIGLAAGMAGAVVFKMADWRKAMAFFKK